MILWLIFDFIAISVGGRFSAHYFVQLYPPFILLAGFAFSELTPRLVIEKFGRVFATLTLIIPLLFAASHWGTYFTKTFEPQKPVVDRNFPATIREVVSMGQTKNDPDKVDEALQKVWMHELADRRIGDLSGGQQQRVFIAKALVNSPKILVLDEPVTGVDVHNKDLFFQILSELNSKEKISVIWSSHDLDAVERLANKVACLNKTLFFHGVSDEFFNDEEMMKKYSETSMQMHMHHH